MFEWLDKTCNECGGKFFVRNDWIKPPRSCDSCRVKKIDNIIPKLQDYIRKRSKFDNRPIPAEDRQEILKDLEVRQKVKKILSISDEKEALSRLISDKNICRLIFKIEKQRKLNSNLNQRYKAQRGKSSIAKGGGIVQGGAPGLGKKS